MPPWPTSYVLMIEMTSSIEPPGGAVQEGIGRGTKGSSSSLGVDEQKQFGDALQGFSPIYSSPRSFFLLMQPRSFGLEPRCLGRSSYLLSSLFGKAREGRGATAKVAEAAAEARNFFRDSGGDGVYPRAIVKAIRSMRRD